MTVVTLRLNPAQLNALLGALSYAMSNVDDLNEARDSDIDVRDLETLHNVLEAKK